jgi:hypothetical protein
MVRKAFQQGFY